MPSRQSLHVQANTFCGAFAVIHVRLFSVLRQCFIGRRIKLEELMEKFKQFERASRWKLLVQITRWLREVASCPFSGLKLTRLMEVRA